MDLSTRICATQRSYFEFEFRHYFYHLRSYHRHHHPGYMHLPFHRYHPLPGLNLHRMDSYLKHLQYLDNIKLKWKKIESKIENDIQTISYTFRRMKYSKYTSSYSVFNSVPQHSLAYDTQSFDQTDVSKDKCYRQVDISVVEMLPSPKVFYI